MLTPAVLGYLGSPGRQEFRFRPTYIDYRYSGLKAWLQRFCNLVISTRALCNFFFLPEKNGLKVKVKVGEEKIV